MTREERPLRPKAEAIIARGKAAAIIIGALGTALTAAWGAFRTHPEPGAKASYEVLKEAITYERDRREDLEKEVAILKAIIEYQATQNGKVSPLKNTTSIVPLAPSATPSPLVPVPTVLTELKRPLKTTSAPPPPALPKSTSLF